MINYLIDPNVPEDDAYEVLLRVVDGAARKVVGMVKCIFGRQELEEYAVMQRSVEVLQGPNWVKCVIAGRRNGYQVVVS